MWTQRHLVKTFLAAFVITFACVGWAYLLRVSAIVSQSRAELFVDCLVASAISVLLYPWLTALLTTITLKG